MLFQPVLHTASLISKKLQIQSFWKPPKGYPSPSWWNLNSWLSKVRCFTCLFCILVCWHTSYRLSNTSTHHCSCLYALHRLFLRPQNSFSFVNLVSFILGSFSLFSSFNTHHSWVLPSCIPWLLGMSIIFITGCCNYFLSFCLLQEY